MTKVSSKELLNSIKQREKTESRENVTFRIKSILLTEFRKKCEKENVKMSDVVEEFIQLFLKD